MLEGMDRSQARMALFERCAALLLAELDARESGDQLGAEALRAERDALHAAWEGLGTVPVSPEVTFPEALDNATTELAHREAVDQALRERLAALGAAAARTLSSPPGARATLRLGSASGVNPFRCAIPSERALDVTF